MYKILFWVIFLSFLILPLPAYPFSFAVFGDSLKGDSTYKRLIETINSDKDIKFCIHLGDFAEEGKLKEYNKHIKMNKLLNVPIYHVKGNHDAVHLGYKYFKDFFGRSYYSFDYENAHFIVLDNALKNNFTKYQYDFMLEDFKKNSKDHIFVFFHKPVFDSTTFFPDFLMDSRQMGDLMMKVFKKYTVKYVFSGHLHAYGRAEREGVVYIVSGGAGSPLHLPLFAGGFHHYIKVTVKDNKVVDETVKIY